MLWLFLLPVTLWLLYLYGRSPYNLWQRVGLEGPEPVAFVGNVPLQGKGGMKEVYGKWIKQYGRVVGFYHFRRHMVLVADPDLLKRILVKEFDQVSHRFLYGPFINPVFGENSLFFVNGPKWKRIRSIASPVFSPKKLKLITSIIVDCASRLADKLAQSGDSKTVDVKFEVGATVMNIIASAGFNIPVDSIGNPNEPVIKYGRELVKERTLIIFIMAISSMFPTILEPLITKVFRIFYFKKENLDFFTETIDRMTIERKSMKERGQKVPNDILQLFLDAEADETDIDNNQQRSLTPEEVASQAATFFLAGFETVSSTIRFLFYELARNPDVQQSMYEEINEVLGDQDPTYDLCRKLLYMDAAIKETLRMYPVVIEFSRTNPETFNYDGLIFPPHTGFVIPVYNIGRDPNLYDCPESFNPDRFLKMNEDSSSQQATEKLLETDNMPFGYGPRRCIGERYALLQIKVVVCQVLRKVELFDATPQKLELFDYTSVLRPTVPVKVKVKARQMQE